MEKGVKKHGWVAALILANQGTRINIADQDRSNLFAGYEQIKSHIFETIIVIEFNFTYFLRTGFSLCISEYLVVTVGLHLLAD